jgi:hypothetical protein
MFFLVLFYNLVSLMTAFVHPTSEADRDDIVADRGRSVMMMRRHRVSGATVPGHLTWGLVSHDADARPDIAPPMHAPRRLQNCITV